MTKLDSILKSRDTFPTKVHLVKAMVFIQCHVWMWELDCKEGWAAKNWCFWTVVLEKTLESLLDSEEIKPVNPKGNQSWIFTGRTDAQAKAPILWPPDAKGQFTGKEPEAGKDWGQEKKRVTRGWDGWMASLTQATWVLGKFWETVKHSEAWRAAVHGVTKSRQDLSDRTTSILNKQISLLSSREEEDNKHHKLAN